MQSPTLENLPPDMVLALKELWESRSEQDDTNNDLIERLERTTHALKTGEAEWEQKEARSDEHLAQALAQIVTLERETRELQEATNRNKRVHDEQVESTIASSEGEMQYVRSEVERLNGQLKSQRTECDVLEDKIHGLEELNNALEDRILEAEEETNAIAYRNTDVRSESPMKGYTSIANSELADLQTRAALLEEDTVRLNDCIEVEREQHQQRLDDMELALRSSQARADASNETEDHLRTRLAEQAAELAELESNMPIKDACLTCQLQAAETKQIADLILKQMAEQAKIVEGGLKGSAAKDVKLAALDTEIRFLKKEVRLQRHEYDMLIEAREKSSATLAQTYRSEADSLQAHLRKLIAAVQKAAHSPLPTSNSTVNNSFEV
jgi:septal ring factor EnvC (AmiA/AmiB activator)